MMKSGLEAEAGMSTGSANERTPLVDKNGEHGDDTSGKSRVSGGLSVSQTTFLIVGEMAGSGVLALPRALVRTGWIGVPILVLMGVVAAFSGKRLGDCWSIIENRDPEMRGRKRNPYAIIADKALGKTWSLTGMFAFGGTLVACILYFIQMMNEVRPFVYRYGLHGFQEFFLAFGTIMFAFSGASTFPTIQNDMTDKNKFNQCLQYSFTAILLLYLPIAIAGYMIYGESVAPNVSASLSATPLTLVGNILMALHLAAAFIIIINPVCQEMEELYNVPRDSTGWRMVVRISIMMGLLFFGESIPRFYTILALVGGTSAALLTFILPCYCYLRLVEQPPGDGPTAVETPGWMKMVCWEVIVLGAVGGIAATYSAMSAIFSTAQATPCYLR